MFTKTLREIDKQDVGIAGGKGASLGEMTGAGIPVPPGFVVLARAFERFLEETDLNVEIDAMLHTVNHREMHTIEHASEKIRALILAAKMPKDIMSEIKKKFVRLGAQFVAVRSSATAEDSASAAWAGQLDSFLNTTKDNLLQNVQKCWASLFTPRAIFYRFELFDKSQTADKRGLKAQMHADTEKISVAVVVQKMIESEVSGIAFSVHPVTEDRNQMIIEAGFGLGEPIVSGQITPDSYVIEKRPRRIIDKNISVQERALYQASLYLSKEEQKEANEWKTISKGIGAKPKLSDKEILELSGLILRIEKHYGFPCDIEWAFAEDKFYILQSRPITTLKQNANVSSRDNLEINSQSYDFLWTVGGFHYLFISIWLTREMLKRDFINIYKDRIWTCYISKMERRILGEEGSALYTKRFWSYKKKVNNQIPSIKRFLETGELKDFPKLTNKELAQDFKQAIREFQKMFELYFWTEYFCTDKIAIKLLNKEEDSKTLAESVKEMGMLKYKLRELLNRAGLLSSGLLQRYCREFGSRLSLPYEKIVQHHFKEIINSLLEKEVDIPDRSTIVLGRFSSWEPVYGEVAFRIIRELSGNFNPNTTSVLNGSVGNKGFYKGRVKKIDFSLSTDFAREIAKMKRGDVLVSGSTGPEMILACKKAGAIITDEGGIISHAAIVSRELGIPCIIGTKIATKVLKDGDMVEVDAERGIVKIIKRAETK